MAVAPTRLGYTVEIGARAALVVDDEPQVLTALGGWLADAGWRAVTASTASQAIRASRDPCLLIAIVDYRLTSGNDGIRLGRILRLRRGLPFVLMSGYLSTAVVVEAIKAGAVDVIDKPLTEDRLAETLRRGPSLDSERQVLGAVRGTVGLPKHDAAANAIQPAAVRWARLVLKACSALEDPRRVSDCAAAACVSEGTFDETCRLSGVGARESRDLARTLRAIARALLTGTAIWTHLAMADERTLNAFLKKAGISRSTRTVVFHEFFLKQGFIAPTRPCLRELAHLAANSRLFF